MNGMPEIMEIYELLLKHFGKQNWWPISNDFEPKEWEICTGAILTQNTNWKNVELALKNMKKCDCISPQDVIKMENKDLEQIIKPSGFYREKTKKLKVFSEFVLKFNSVPDFLNKVEREELLSVKGIGPETADSILLYAANRHYFVIDAYTKRVCNRTGLINEENYEKLRLFFEENMLKDVEIYKELHALVVMLCKYHCKKKPFCLNCPLEKTCISLRGTNTK